MPKRKIVDSYRVSASNIVKSDPQNRIISWEVLTISDKTAPECRRGAYFHIFLKNCDFVKYSILPRKNQYFSYVELLKNNENSPKNQQKININLELEKNASKML